MNEGGSGPGRGDRAQTSVEVALVLPVVALLLLAVVQVGLVVRDQVLVTHAAREAARAAAVDPSPGAALAAARGSGPLDPGRLTVEVSGGGGPPGSHVRVVVSYAVPTDVPLAGSFLADVVVRADATMRVESGAVRGLGPTQ